MLLAVGFLSLPVVAQSYEAQWKEVERLQRDALPASVVWATDKIYAQAEREGDFPQMLKAWLTRVKARRAISPDSVYVDVARLNEWGEAEPDAVRRSLLRMVLGNAYVELGRRAPSVAGTSDGPLSDDLSEWPHADFQNAMRRAYAEALSDMPLLARTSVDDYALLIEKGAESALFGHDLLSLVVGEVTDRCDDFAYVADVYARAVECYRALGKADAACLMQLARMRYLYERNSPEGNSLYRNRDAYVDSLRSLLSRHASMAPYICQEWADTEQEDSVKYALCREALQKYPHYKFVDFFRLQIDRLTSPQLSFSVDGTVLEGRPLELKVVHRSVPLVRVRVKEAQSGRVLQTKDFKLVTPVPYAMNVTTLSLSPLPRAGRYVVEMQAGGETRRLELNYSRLRPVIRRLPDGTAIASPYTIR